MDEQNILAERPAMTANGAIDYSAIEQQQTAGIGDPVRQAEAALRVAEQAAQMTRDPKYRMLLDEFKELRDSSIDQLLAATAAGETTQATMLTGKILLLRSLIDGPERAHRALDEVQAELARLRP